MEKGCQCASYNCRCYETSNINPWKEDHILQLLWNVEAMWDTDSIKTKKYSKECLNKAIELLKSRGRE